VSDDVEMTRDQLIAALCALGEKLTARGVHAQMFIVGGAAMALVYSGRRMTGDIDAVFEPKAIIYDLAAEVAREQGLPGGWLNDGVKGFMPTSGEDRNRKPIPGFPGIEVSVASPEYLLAMKLMSLRMDEDTEDIEILLRECGITTAAEAVALLERLYPRVVLPPGAQFYLEQELGPMERP
jgi:hypothetical protein